MRGSFKAVIVALSVALAASGCGTSVGQWFASSPSGLDQQAGLSVAMKGARVMCARLATRALKTGEVAALGKSLDYVSALLAETPDIDGEKLATDLARVSPEASEFAPEILGVVVAAAALIPPEQRDATYYLLVQGVVGQCRGALGDTA